MTLNTDTDFNTIDRLFYDYHSECETIIMDMTSEKIDRNTFDTVFSDLDELQENYHNRLKDLFREGECL